VFATLSCSKSSDASLTGRLWVSELPSDRKGTLTAFVLSPTRGPQHTGTFYQGSLYRGRHDVFRWHTDDDLDATLIMLQDGKRHRVRVESCRPSHGFDRCILLHGDPMKVTRYQSRNRWGLGPRAESAQDAVTVLWDEAGQDHEVEALLEQLSDQTAK